MKTATTHSSARWLWFVVALQAVFLLSWAGYHEVIRHTAPTIRLKGAPVDPRDILRGDYMTLNYEISRHELPKDRPKGQSEVYVVLKPQGGFYVIDSVLAQKPADNDPRRWVVGEVDDDSNRITYGIERFFVPEGKGTPRFKTLEVDASVSPAHRLYIKRVLLDGKQFP